MIIKELKIEESVFININIKEEDENGVLSYPELQDVKKLRDIAIDTLNWKIKKEVLKAAGGKQSDLIVANSKASVLLAKTIALLNPNLEDLTALEKESFEIMLNLAESGYSDSNKLKDTLQSVAKNIPFYTEKIQRVTIATSVEEIVEILNEE